MTKLPGRPKPITLREFSAKGGRARAASLTPERRREIALRAVRAREAKKVVDE